MNKEKQSYFIFYGFVRYLTETGNLYFTTNTERFTAFDLGAKTELELGKFSIGYEYINRSGDLQGYRSAGVARYRALENIYLTGVFGKNFGDRDDLIAIFGVQWGLNNPVQSIAVGGE